MAINQHTGKTIPIQTNGSARSATLLRAKPGIDKTEKRARDKMKRYVDPRTGTVSFSGADMTGVIFLPISTEQLKNHVRIKKTELIEMRSTLKEYREPYQALSDQLKASDTLVEVYEAEYLYYLNLVEGGHPEHTPTLEYYDSLRRTALTASLDIVIKLNKYSGSDLKKLENKVDIAQAELDDLFDMAIQGGKHTRPITLFDLQTVSISKHREKFPVRTLGRVAPKSSTRGPRTIAGSFIFTLFNKAALWDLLMAHMSFYSTGVSIPGSDSGFPELGGITADQLPPFDLTIMCSNELGDNSYMTLYGIEIVNDGMTMSIQDMITENVMQFTALDMDVLRPLNTRAPVLKKDVNVITPDNRIREMHSQRKRRNIRLNPFI